MVDLNNIRYMEINYQLYPKGHIKLLLDFLDEENINWVWDINDRLFIPKNIFNDIEYLKNIKQIIKEFWKTKFNINLNDGIFTYG